MTIVLTQGKVAVIDAGDWPVIAAYTWHAVLRRGRWYAETCIWVEQKVKSLKMHRLVMGVTDPAIQVDHRDGDGLNNQKHNLRRCSNMQNACNAGPRRHNRAGIKGVQFRPALGKWRARIRVEKKLINLGHFATAEEAAKAYRDASVVYHGEFARTDPFQRP